MQSKAATVEQYLAELPPDRRETLQAVRKVILDNLDKDYTEGMSYGMIGYSIPHSIYPKGYHCDPRQPLPFAGMASQKNHMSLYLMSVYCGCEGGEPTPHARWFREAWLKTGKKLDMGKACIRFKRIEDVALDVVGEAVRRVPAKMYINWMEKTVAHLEATKGERSAAQAKAAKKPGKQNGKKVVKKAAKKLVKKTSAKGAKRR